MIDYSTIYDNDELFKEMAKITVRQNSPSWSYGSKTNNPTHLRISIPNTFITIDFIETRYENEYMIEGFNTKFVRTKCKGTIKITIQDRNYICYEGYVTIPETDEQTYIEQIENLIQSLKGSKNYGGNTL